jgi:hypothetical protein
LRLNSILAWIKDEITEIIGSYLRHQADSGEKDKLKNK